MTDSALLDTTQTDALVFVLACGGLCLAAGIILGYGACRAFTDRKFRKWLRAYKQPRQSRRPVKVTVREVGQIEKPTPAWRYYI